MTKKIFASIVVLIAFGSWVPVYGHHSFAAYFNIDKSVTIEGVVTEFWLVNPHSRIYLDVTTDDNTIEQWVVECSSRNVYSRTGISQETITPGMVLTIIGNPSRDGSKMIGIGKQANFRVKDGRQIWPPQR